MANQHTEQKLRLIDRAGWSARLYRLMRLAQLVHFIDVTILKDIVYLLILIYVFFSFPPPFHCFLFSFKKKISPSLLFPTFLLCASRGSAELLSLTASFLSHSLYTREPLLILPNHRSCCFSFTFFSICEPVQIFFCLLLLSFILCLLLRSLRSQPD